MSDFRKQWAITHRRPRPGSTTQARRVQAACDELGLDYTIEAAYAEFVASLPRPVGVWKSGFTSPRSGQWIWVCRLCPEDGRHSGRVAALDAALRHLHDAHGCPNRHTTGEPCDPQCTHCHGWQWCAEPNERREV